MGLLHTDCLGRSKRSARNFSLAIAASAALVGMGSLAMGTAIDVQLSRTAITPASYPVVGAAALAGAPITIPDAPGATYDAADTTDTGTQWNTLAIPQTTVANTSGNTVTTLEESNVPLVDSGGNSTSVLLDMSYIEPNNKTDDIHPEGITSGTNPGSDGLSSNPTGLMNQSWQTNGTTELIQFTLTNLTPGGAYNLYIYGSGTKDGDGGTYSIAPANQDGPASITIEPNASAIYRSVFDSTGINPSPELGLSWGLLPAVADSTGAVSFTVNEDSATAIKGSINGFQIDAVPEPVSGGIFLIGGAAAMLRRRGKGRNV